jgi:6-pyruvoyltetrahydropterin/6-carboxytetrahydropterin synthase
MIYVTRKEHFNAAHRVYNPSWTDEENLRVFGICANQNFHGHNFELWVTVKGPIHPDTGFVVDMKKLGDMMKEAVIDKVDHRNLNLDVDFMQGIIPSCENFIVQIWNILAARLPELSSTAQLHYIKLIETPKNYVEYYGEYSGSKAL